MIGLSGSLSIAENALAAQYAGLAVTNNNIANANTTGYSRQVVSLSSVAYCQDGKTVDGGVSFNGYTSVRNAVLNLAINAKTSEQSSLTAQDSVLAPVNTSFSGTSTGIGASISSFFSTVSALSVSPADLSARQAVINAADELVTDFHQGAASLQNAAAGADSQVSSTVSQINQLTKQIADLHGEVLQSNASGQNGGALQDQLDQLTTSLAQLTGISFTKTDTMPTMTTSSGSLLVLGSTSYPLQVSTGTDGKAHILDYQGQDVTAKLSGGTLGGILAARDTTIPALSKSLDDLASQFAAAVNSAQTSGYDLTGKPGLPIFTVPASGSAAQGITLAFASGAGIALSSSASSPGNGNLPSFLSVEAMPLPSGSTPIDAYSALIGQIGNAVSHVRSQLTAATASINQLNAQKDSESGVSVDQEAINLIRYQQAYTAAAKVIATINTLYGVVMNMAQVTG